MSVYYFSKYIPKKQESTFDRLLDLFKELIVHTSGDVDEALSWMNELDRKYNLTDANYGIGNFIEDLKQKGFLDDKEQDGRLTITPKVEQSIRQNSLEQAFGKMRKSNSRGNHSTPYLGGGEEPMPEMRSYEFGDSAEHIVLTESIKNAHINHGFDNFRLEENDLLVQEQEFKAQTSTVLMIDISHSMILYGEDRITPAKKTAMALAELIKTRYPKDTLDILTFGDDAAQITIKDLPYLQVGPYHTNTVAGLEMAMNLLRHRKNPNKQILMITDGKPTCIKEGGQYYKNSWGLDRKIINRTMNMAAQLKRIKIPVTTFMIARDPYLQKFVRDFTEVNGGKAFYSDLEGLGGFIFQDFQNNRVRKGF